MADASPEMTADRQVALGRAAAAAAERFAAEARAALRAAVAPNGKVDAARFEERQHAAHAFAWIAAYAAALIQLQDWGERAVEAGRFGETARLIHLIGFGEYLAQLAGGIPMTQTEFARPADLSLAPDAVAAFTNDPAVAALTADGLAPEARRALADRLVAGEHADPLLGDDTLTMMQDQCARFGAEHVLLYAHRWHLEDRLIPIELVEGLAELGVFGVTIAPEHGGLGLGKVAMCVVTEALSRCYLGVGSLGTRAEIAGELIGNSGTAEQKARFLPAIASGACLPTAVFTEPDIGSDLAHLKTRAVRDGDVYRVHGAKTWITQAARADLMTLLVRTNPDKPDHNGLSMLLAEKPRGTTDNPFPVAGLSGGEMPTLGYRGLKEYDLAFDGFEVAAENLLGGVEGEGFRQLMTTFESARVQTAARAVGVAASAFDAGLAYALERRQFGKPLAAFPRIADKLALMAVETMMARQLTLYAARTKDAGRRSDVEAGMAKLLAARVAWSSADNALQIHGGAGYALETPVSRLLVDARILNIFEGTGEIQAQVIARGLLSGRN